MKGKYSWASLEALPAVMRSAAKHGNEVKLCALRRVKRRITSDARCRKIQVEAEERGERVYTENIKKPKIFVFGRQ